MEQKFVTIPCEVVEQTLKVLEYAANDVLTGRNAAVALREALERPQTDLAAAYRAELDTMSNRNYELRMENAHLKACQQQCDQASNWKLVPVEPTREMIDRVVHMGPDVCFIYEEMLNAAPELPQITDQELEQLWYPSASIAEPGKRRVAFGRAVLDRVFGKLQKGSKV